MAKTKDKYTFVVLHTTLQIKHNVYIFKSIIIIFYNIIIKLVSGLGLLILKYEQEIWGLWLCKEIPLS